METNGESGNKWKNGGVGRQDRNMTPFPRMLLPRNNRVVVLQVGDVCAVLLQEDRPDGVGGIGYRDGFVLEPLVRADVEIVVIEVKVKGGGLVAPPEVLGRLPDAILCDAFDPVIIELPHNLLTLLLHGWERRGMTARLVEIVLGCLGYQPPLEVPEELV